MERSDRGLFCSHDLGRVRSRAHRGAQGSRIQFREVGRSGRIQHETVLDQGIGWSCVDQETDARQIVRRKVDVGRHLGSEIAPRSQQLSQTELIVRNAPAQAYPIAGAAVLHPVRQQRAFGQVGELGRGRAFHRHRVTQGRDGLVGQDRHGGVMEAAGAAEQSEKCRVGQFASARTERAPCPPPISETHGCPPVSQW